MSDAAQGRGLRGLALLDAEAFIFLVHDDA